MKAIQISHNQELNIIELEKPQALKAGEVLLKLEYKVVVQHHFVKVADNGVALDVIIFLLL